MSVDKRVFAAVLFMFLAASSGFGQQSDDWYLGKPIRDITFSGLKNVKAADLEGLVKPYRGKILTDSVMWEIQSTLYETEYFDIISPSALPVDNYREVTIRFEVTERPVISRINFIGNSGLRRTELLELISMKINDVMNVAKVHVDELAIANKYLEKGYPDIRVSSDVKEVSEYSVSLNFIIDEGEKVVIKEFRFEGNAIFSERNLRSQLSLKAKSMINDGAFQEAKLLADKEALTRYYHDRGYIEAEVIDVTRDVQKDEKGNNGLTLTFKIFEGRIFTFGGVTFSGNRIFSTEQLEKLITSKVGDTVNERKLEADLQRVADLYYENGYIFNTIGRDENKDASAGVISYHIPIVERGRAHIENIIIRGNEKTKTDVILREIPLEPGDVFSKSKIMDAMRNLYNLQYFSMIVPDTPLGSADNLMDLIFNVEEQPTIDLQLGLTFSGSSDPDTFPVSALVKWNDRNFRGSGNQLGLDINAAPDSANAALNYTQRWIFGLPLSGGFDFSFQWAKRQAALAHNTLWFDSNNPYAFPAGFDSYQEYIAANKISPKEHQFTLDQFYLSLGFSTGYRWATALGNLTLSGGVRTGFIQNKYDALLYTPFDPAIREENNTWSPKNSIWSSLSLDQRDIYYDPSKGYYATERFGVYGVFPHEREHYFRSDTKAEYFFTLFNIPVGEKWNFKSVFGIHSGISFIIKQPGGQIEDANKLMVDGMFVGRGWTSVYHIKGLMLWENWLELRFPLVPGILAWDFFFDAATVESKEGSYFKGYSFNDMCFSLGGAFRFTVPQFPFRFGVAKLFRNVNGKTEWEKGMAFVFSFAISNY